MPLISIDIEAIESKREAFVLELFKDESTYCSPRCRVSAVYFVVSTVDYHFQLVTVDKDTVISTKWGPSLDNRKD